MPGWFIHLDVAKSVADILAAVVEPRTNDVGTIPISSFQSNGWTPEQLSAIIQEYPNYYALGAIGPDIFFLLPDFKGRSGNFIAKLAEWVIKYYDLLDAQVFKPWEDIMGPIEENTAEELSRLTGDLNREIGNVMKYASGIVTEAILDFASRLYDFFGIFGTGVSQGYDDSLFFWSDMFHYRYTNEFARDLFAQATSTSYTEQQDAQGNVAVTKGKGTYEPGVAFALGWMTHVGTDVTGHAFVNEKSGGPYRLHWQRHHLVENHMDAHIYDARRGKDDLYNMMALSALHFWIQFNKNKGYKPDYNYFHLDDQHQPDHFPTYPTGLKARDYYDRKKAFDVDSEIPQSLSTFLLDTMKVTFYDHHASHDDGLPAHPMILEAIIPDGQGRPDTTLMHTTYELLFKFVKYTTTDYYKMPKPQPPEVFPNLDPPLPPGQSDDAPGENDQGWDFWKALLAIFAWIRYIIQWIEYVLTILPAIILDLATYPARYVLYPIEEALYELWKAFHYLLVLEGYVVPQPDEIDLGLIQLGTPSEGPYQGLLKTVDDVFGGLLGDNPNPVPPSEPVHDRLYPRQSVMDDPNLVTRFVREIGSLLFGSRQCGTKMSSEFLRPWEYPLQNNDHSAIGMELGHTRASPFNVSSLPDTLFAPILGTDEARQAYEHAASPAETNEINTRRLNEEWNLGNPVFYSLYVMGQLTRANAAQLDVQSFNLDADRGYGYKCWDWDRHSDESDHKVEDTNVSFRVPCTPPQKFCPDSIPGETQKSGISLQYDPSAPLNIHYIGQPYTGCDETTPPIQ